jgi:hypothetical protein
MHIRMQPPELSAAAPASLWHELSMQLLWYPGLHGTFVHAIAAHPALKRNSAQIAGNALLKPCVHLQAAIAASTLSCAQIPTMQTLL